MYEERMQRAPAKYRVMYVDYSFVKKQMNEALKFYREIHPEKELTPSRLKKLPLMLLSGCMKNHLSRLSYSALKNYTMK